MWVGIFYFYYYYYYYYYKIRNRILIIFKIVGSRFWGAPLTVNVSKLKPNKPNTMNLVKKQA